MKRTLMRRQVLKIVGGMALSPWSPPAASTQADGVQQTVAALLAATEEGSILQIDLEELRETLNLCGSSPVSFTVTNHDADKLLDACRDALARMPTHSRSCIRPMFSPVSPVGQCLVSGRVMSGRVQWRCNPGRTPAIMAPAAAWTCAI